MNENLEKDKIQLGGEKPQLLPSKSLLNTIKLGYNVKPVPPPPANHIDFIEGDSVMTTISTGFEHNDKPVPPPPEINLGCKIPKKKNPDSVIGSIDTGFGCDNQIVIDCPKPNIKLIYVKKIIQESLKQNLRKHQLEIIQEFIVKKKQIRLLVRLQKITTTILLLERKFRI